MDAWKLRRVMIAVGVVTLLGAVGCAAEQNIDVVNASGVAVTVQFGEEDLGEVTPDGGVVLLGATRCYQGPIVVTYAPGSTIELEGPICPGQTLTVSGTTARIAEGTQDPRGNSF